MAEKDREEKKIIVDDNWKEQAQKEKEELIKEEKTEKETSQTEEERPPLPPANFTSLVSMLATQAFFALGLIRTEEDKEQPVDFNMARYNIDMLTVLEEKTKGNLSDEEEKLLTGALEQVRMSFVKLSESK